MCENVVSLRFVIIRFIVPNTANSQHGAISANMPPVCQRATARNKLPRVVVSFMLFIVFHQMCSGVVVSTLGLTVLDNGSSLTW